MLKKSKFLLLPVCLFASSMAASAEDGTITFTGTISDATCIVEGGTEAGLTPSGTFTVNLKPVSTTALSAAGKKAGDTPFYISLSGADCPNGKFANVPGNKQQALKLTVQQVICRTQLQQVLQRKFRLYFLTKINKPSTYVRL